uniref:Fumarate hydratase n=1 Tax=Staphylothermus marinus TaxID=2280 RepID=A0A7C4H8G3_STAMA
MTYSKSLEELRNTLENAIVEALEKAVNDLPVDVINALKKAYENEESEIAKAQLKSILDNVEIASSKRRPICQDTGLINYYVRVGCRFPLINKIEEIIVNATKKATLQIPLRPNTVNPLTGENPGDNTGRYVPVTHIELTESDEIVIDIVPKGGGSESMTILKMPPPGRGLAAVKEIVIDAVLTAGAQPCPPTILGVGIGGGADTAVYLAKKQANVRKIGSSNPDPVLDKLEKELFNAINELGIGVMGLGGKTTVLAVHIDYAHRHPAAYPVAVAFQCWAARRSTVYMDSKGYYRITQ